MGAVTGSGLNVGGLIGYANSFRSVSNSYATGAVMGTVNVGGLIGRARGGNRFFAHSVSNSYATGAVTGTGNVGGLIGVSHSLVSNSYATGDVMGNSRSAGGLIGFSAFGGSVTGKNYFVDASGTNGIGSGNACLSTDCVSQTAAQIAGLSSTSTPPAPSGWTTGSTGNWDFGTTSQLPALKYAQNPATTGPRWCGSGVLPACGTLIPGQR